MISVRIEGEDDFVTTFESLGPPESLAQEIRRYSKLVASGTENTLTSAESSRVLTILRAANDVTALGPPYDEALRQSGLFSAISTLVKVLVNVQSPSEEISAQVEELVHYASETMANCSQATRTPRLTSITVSLPNSGRMVQIRAAPLSYAQVETAGLFWAASFVLGLFVGNVSCEDRIGQCVVVQAPVRMVELGCGTGAASLIAAGFLAQCQRAAGASLSSTLSDFPSVVAQAMVNVELNYKASDSQIEFKALPLDLLATSLSSSAVETQATKDDAQGAIGFEVVLLSDMFYSIPLMPHVLRWAKSLLSNPGKGYPSGLDELSPMEAAKTLFQHCVSSSSSSYGGLVLASTTTFRDGMPLLESLVNESGLAVLACIPAQEFLKTELATSCRPGLVQAARIIDYRIYVLGHKS
jgi:hypothetical protein